MESIFVVPKPDPETGLHPAVRGLNFGGGYAHLSHIGAVNVHTKRDIGFSIAYVADTDYRVIWNRTYVRSHSPDAGLDVPPYIGRGYGYALYCALTLFAFQHQHRAGIWSPAGVGKRSEEADLMWERLVKLKAASEETAGLARRVVNYMNVGHVLRGGYCLDWDAANDPENSHGYRSDFAKWLAEWIVKPHVVVRADLGPRAKPADVEVFMAAIQKRFPGAEGKELARQFRNREDMIDRFGAPRARRRTAVRVPAVAALSGLSFGSAQGKSGPESLPSLTTAERTDDAAWSKVDW